MSTNIDFGLWDLKKKERNYLVSFKHLFLYLNAQKEAFLNHHSFDELKGQVGHFYHDNNLKLRLHVGVRKAL